LYPAGVAYTVSAVASFVGFKFKASFLHEFKDNSKIPDANIILNEFFILIFYLKTNI